MLKILSSAFLSKARYNETTLK